MRLSQLPRGSYAKSGPLLFLGLGGGVYFATIPNETVVKGIVRKKKLDVKTQPITREEFIEAALTTKAPTKSSQIIRDAAIAFDEKAI